MDGWETLWSTVLDEPGIFAKNLGTIVEGLEASIDVDYEPEEISLAAFIAEAWDVLEPFEPYQENWHIHYLAEYLEAVTFGEITRLIINIAPRHMKSLLCSVMWPCWEWTFRPESRWLFASYAEDLAHKHSVDRRTLMQSDWYRSRWGRSVIFTPDQNQKGRFSNMRRGEMTAVSFGGRVTGLGGNRIVIDDPMNPRMADSDTERESAINFYRKTLHNRLNQPDRDAMVLVMQRLHENDMVGYLKDQEWERVVIPTEAEVDEQRVGVRSGVVYSERKEGDLLWPERFTPAVIAATKLDLGPDYAAQHQQRPVPITGGIIKDHYWRYYEWAQRDVVLRLASQVDIFTDTALKTGEENDWSVAAVWALVLQEHYSGFPSGFYLVDLWREKAEFGALKQSLTNLVHAYPNLMNIVVEDKVSGTSLIQEFQNALLPVLAFNPGDVDKVRRLKVKSGYLEGGLAHLPMGAPWLTEFLSEHRWFPKGEHDDMVDTTSMMLHHYSARVMGWGMDDAEVQAFFQLAG